MKNLNFNIEDLGVSVSNTYSVIYGLIDKNLDILDIKNIELTIPHAKIELSSIYDYYTDYREKVYSLLSYQIKEVQTEIEASDFDLKEERIKTLSVFHNIINGIFGKPIVYESIKLELNLPKNVIYDLIKQLKNLTFDGKTPILTQSNQIIAEFLINYIEGFEKSNIETVSKEISREQSLKKGKLEINKIN